MRNRCGTSGQITVPGLLGKAQKPGTKGVFGWFLDEQGLASVASPACVGSDILVPTRVGRTFLSDKVRRPYSLWRIPVVNVEPHCPESTAILCKWHFMTLCWRKCLGHS